MSEGTQMRSKRHPHGNLGFSLIETMFAIVLLMVGVLSLGLVLSAGISYMNTSKQDFIAQQKAQETVESIFAARDTGVLAFPSIQNVGNGPGIFVNGALPLCDPGPDGIVGTADDDCTKPDSIVAPGPDGILGTADDVITPLGNFTRTVVIANVAGNSSLREITVTVSYRTGRVTRSYTANTLISAVF
jgi:type II secretory pathway pseudopilin PulG